MCWGAKKIRSMFLINTLLVGYIFQDYLGYMLVVIELSIEKFRFYITGESCAESLMTCMYGDDALPHHIV